jgi:carbon-monoxide dehydrogenase large subunit
VVICVETPEERGPYGARCIAEHPMVAVSATILNALYDATGHDFFTIPVTKDELMEVIKNA